MKRPKTGVLFVNVGTPDSPKTADVRRYLRQFLMDGRVVDIPAWRRFLLVNLIIAPLRAPKSAKAYRELWTEEGSPLMNHSCEFTRQVQRKLGDDFVVALAMRYQNPSIESVLEPLRQQRLARIIVFPLFPQYASATVGTVHERVMKVIRGWQDIPELHFINSCCEHPKVIETYADRGRRHLAKEQFDHILLTYHGLPERQIKRENPDCLESSGCCDELHDGNHLCYRAQCYATSRCLADALGLEESEWTVSFQSRLGRDPWIQPYTEDALKALAAKGVKRILAFSPSFVADCLETTIEVGEEYDALFREKGGERLQLVESLNAHPLWVEAAADIIMEHA